MIPFIKSLAWNFLRTLGLATIAWGVTYLASAQLFPKMAALIISGAVAAAVTMAGTFRFLINIQFLRSLGLTRRQIFISRVFSNLSHLLVAGAFLHLSASASLYFATDQEKASEIYDAITYGIFDLFRFSTGSFLLHFPTDIFFTVTFICIFILMAPISVWSSGRQLNNWKNSLILFLAIIITVGCIAISGLFMWIASSALLWFFLRSTRETLAIPAKAFKKICFSVFGILFIAAFTHFILLIAATDSKNTKDRVSAKILLYKVGFYSQGDLMLEGISKRNIHRFASYNRILSDTNEIATNNTTGLVGMMLAAKNPVQMQEASRKYTKNDLSVSDLQKIALHVDALEASSNFPLNLTWVRMSLSDENIRQALQGSSPTMRLFAIYIAAQRPRESLRKDLLKHVNRNLQNWEAYRIADALSMLVGKKVSLQDYFMQKPYLFHEKLRDINCDRLRQTALKRIQKDLEPEVNICLRQYLLSLPDHEIMELAGYDMRGWIEYPYNSGILSLIEIFQKDR